MIEVDFKYQFVNQCLYFWGVTWGTSICKSITHSKAESVSIVKRVGIVGINVDVVDPLGVEAARSSYQPVDLVAF